MFIKLPWAIVNTDHIIQIKSNKSKTPDMYEINILLKNGSHYSCHTTSPDYTIEQCEAVYHAIATALNAI